MRLRLFGTPDSTNPTVPPAADSGQVQPKSTQPTDPSAALEKEALQKEALSPNDHVETPVSPVGDETSKSRKSLEAKGRTEGAQDIIEESNAASTQDNGKSKETTTTDTPAEEDEDDEAGEAGEDDESKYPKALPLAFLTFGLAMTTVRSSLPSIWKLQKLTYRSVCGSVGQYHYR
jgi:hypothetical protein